MADVKKSFTAKQDFTITLTSLADGSGRQSTEIDNSSNLYLDALVMLTLNGLAGSTANCEIYAFGSVDETVARTDGAGASDAAITVRNAPLIGIVEMNGATAVEAGPFSVAVAFGGVLPQKWGIIVQNESGANLSATGGDFDVDWMGVYETVL